MNIVGNVLTLKNLIFFADKNLRLKNVCQSLIYLNEFVLCWKMCWHINGNCSLKLDLTLNRLAITHMRKSISSFLSFLFSHEKRLYSIMRDNKNENLICCWLNVQNSLHRSRMMSNPWAPERTTTKCYKR